MWYGCRSKTHSRSRTTLSVHPNDHCLVSLLTVLFACVCVRALLAVSLACHLIDTVSRKRFLLPFPLCPRRLIRPLPNGFWYFRLLTSLLRIVHMRYSDKLCREIGHHRSADRSTYRTHTFPPGIPRICACTQPKPGNCVCVCV